MPALGTFSFINYLGLLSPEKQDQLYESEWMCQAVFRSLPPVAKQVVLRLLYVEVPQAMATLDQWASIEGTAKHKVAMDILMRLRVMLDAGTDRSGTKKRGAVKLHPTFQRQIQHSITESSPPEVATLSDEALQQAPSAEEIDRNTEQHWEALLLYLVGSLPEAPLGLGMTACQLRPSLHVTNLLMQADLCTQGENGNLKIKDRGFQFLLMDTQAQLWVLLKQYVQMAESVGGEEVSTALGFLLQMGFQTLRQPYSCQSLTSAQLTVVADLVQLGVLHFFQHRDQQWYYPTKLAEHLASGLAGTASNLNQEGYIVVETNYRVYAYTASPLALAILHIFTRPDYLLPNLYVGTLSMSSVRSALASGISANQIIMFLRHNAHPYVASKFPVVPETISDQIRLWEADRNRVQQQEVVLYEDFPSEESFFLVQKRAHEQGVLLWSNASTKRMAVCTLVTSLISRAHIVVKVAAHQGLREFIKENSRLK